MSEDLEITFGKTVLIEKCPNDIISLGINHLCRDNVPKSHLHCLVSGNGWLTVIRYVDGVALCGPEYSSFRIIMLRKFGKSDLTREEMISFISDEVTEIHYAQEKSFNSINYGVQTIDTGVIICHKKSLVHLLKENIVQCTKESKRRRHNENYFGNSEFGFKKEIPFTHKGSPPCIRARATNNCSILYGGHKKIQKTFLALSCAMKFKVSVNIWLDAEHKSKYEEGKSITIKPV